MRQRDVVRNGAALPWLALLSCGFSLGCEDGAGDSAGASVQHEDSGTQQTDAAPEDVELLAL